MDLNRSIAVADRLREMRQEQFSELGRSVPFDVSEFPDPIAKLLTTRVHGEGLYSIPKLGGDGFSAVFRFATPEEREYFPDNYECLRHCVPIGRFVDHWIVWNRESQVIARFHPSDIVEPDSLAEDVQYEWLSIPKLLSSLKPQTVCHFRDPESGLRYHRFELFADLRLAYERNPMISDDCGELHHSEETAAIDAYFSFIDQALGEGFELVSGPDFLSIDP